MNLKWREEVLDLSRHINAGLVVRRGRVEYALRGNWCLIGATFIMSACTKNGHIS